MDTEVTIRIPLWRDARLIAAIILTAAAMVIPFFVTAYLRTLIQTTFLWIPAIFGVYILYSLLRQVHFAQSIFIGLGAYLAGFLAEKYPLTRELTILIPAILLISIVVGYIVGIFITKRTGFYFAVMGVALTMVFWSVVYKARGITGGSDGIGGLKNPTLFGMDMSDLGLYYFSLLVCVCVIVLMLRILNSSFSLQLRAIAADLEKAESLGIPVHRMQIMAFTIAGACAGVAGVLLAFTYNYVSPSLFTWEYGANFVESAILGGVNYLIGPIVGAFSFINLEFFVSAWFPSLWEIAIGLTVAVIVVSVGEEGFTGIAKSIYLRITRKSGKRQE
jgi:branched-chain amino acid transport system permease protein